MMSFRKSLRTSYYYLQNKKNIQLFENNQLFVYKKTVKNPLIFINN